ncbi:MAG: hypothetical protein ICV87_04395 [Gemmatimonadetes bacterium]|nr:hypothetical protein [Gemmatimonadota bacterium]
MMSAALAAALLAAGGGHAQAVAGAALSLSAGARAYDLGSTPVVALRAEYPVTPTFLIEAAGSVADPVTGVSRAVTSLIEIQAQGQAPGGRVVPYLGVGAGLGRFDAFDIPPAERTTTALLSFGGGARIGIQRQLGLVADARFRRALTERSAGHVDVTVGLRYRFR